MCWTSGFDAKEGGHGNDPRDYTGAVSGGSLCDRKYGGESDWNAVALFELLIFNLSGRTNARPVGSLAPARALLRYFFAYLHSIVPD